MNVQELDFPEKFRPIIRRLQLATQEKGVRDIMVVEDDFISELNDYEQRLIESAKQKEEAFKQKEEAFKQKEEAIKMLLSLGASKLEISIKLGIAMDELDNIQN